MLPTKIPPASTKEEIAEEIIKDVGRRRYVVEKAGTQQILAAGLTGRQAIEFTWLYDGRDYEIRPRMGVLHDEFGVTTEIRHQLVERFGTEWDVYFKDGVDQPWRKSRITAYGENQRAAVLYLLDHGLARLAWSDSFHVRMVGLSDPRKSFPEFSSSMLKRAAIGA